MNEKHHESHESESRLGHWLDERYLDETNLNESIPSTRHDSFADILEESYGARGIGWDLIVEGPISERAALEDELTKIESAVANEDRQRRQMGVSALYPDGVKPPQNRPTRGDFGRIWIYPAGDERRAAQESEHSE